MPFRLSEMSRSLQRTRAMEMPPSPKTIEEIISSFANPSIMEEFGKCKSGSNFYRGAVESDGNGSGCFCVFASDTIINAITSKMTVDKRHYLLDATFKVVPNSQFKQLFIVHVEYVEKVYYAFVTFMITTNDFILYYRFILLYMY